MGPHSTKAAINNGYIDFVPSGPSGNKRSNQSFGQIQNDGPSYHIEAKPLKY